MEELLTTKQVLDILQVDRTTIYRMLKDGRLTGVKVGQQWRFPHSEVEELLSGTPSIPLEPVRPARSTITHEALPIPCLQSVQDVSAETMEVGAVTTDLDGQPLTKVSNSCQFCNLIRSTQTGYQDCVNSWRKLARQHDSAPHFVTCHAGLHYARASIELDDELFAMLVTGQFYIMAPDPDEVKQRVTRLAQVHGLNEADLARAAAELPILSPKKQEKITDWLEKLADTFSLIGRERADMLDRLRRIASMSSVVLE
ncbi:MAG: PocR ligand-binding domain-containing protein [Ardenticatenaceae bacterium]|nr:PocR ligand-binding domain-containing protein [Ardenticatenaceae bacterium]MCB9445071.1 PocR ligand-binding domain-containing protein [Ardenticatenaceae bacterium]